MVGYLGGGVANELELAAGASAGGFVRRAASRHAPPPGTPCANCATPLQGPWCYACGQSGEDFHRSILRLVAEVTEGLLHVDGRLWGTLPDLMVRPGRLTRRYLDGHRAPQIPPLRLFLVVLLAIFVVGGIAGGSKTARHPATAKVAGAEVRVESIQQLSTEDKTKLKDEFSHLNVGPAGGKVSVAAVAWLKDRVLKSLNDPERFQLILEQWSERFAFLMLPVAALLLSFLFVFQRRFFLFDHTIFALHSLSAVGLMLIFAIVTDPLGGIGSFIMIFAAPIHLFGHLRGVYRTSVVGTLARMVLLFTGSVVAAAFLVLGLIAVGLNGMGT